MSSVICKKGKHQELQGEEFQGIIVCILTYLTTIEMLVINALGATISNPFETPSPNTQNMKENDATKLMFMNKGINYAVRRDFTMGAGIVENLKPFYYVDRLFMTAQSSHELIPIVADGFLPRVQ